MGKLSYEHGAYESVHDRIKPVLGYISKINGKQYSGSKGLRLFEQLSFHTFMNLLKNSYFSWALTI